MHRKISQELAALKIDHQRVSKVAGFNAGRGEPVAGQMMYGYGNYEEK